MLLVVPVCYVFHVAFCSRRSKCYISCITSAVGLKYVAVGICNGSMIRRFLGSVIREYATYSADRCGLVRVLWRSGAMTACVNVMPCDFSVVSANVGVKGICSTGTYILQLFGSCMWQLFSLCGRTGTTPGGRSWKYCFSDCSSFMKTISGMGVVT